MEKVSVVVTVLNEEKTIDALLTSLTSQTKKPAEILIVDGGSTDKTVEKIRKHKVTLLQKSGNRSIGRNYGIAKAKSKIIAFTDAGCIPHSDWLEELIKPFADRSVRIVSGYYEGKAENAFQKSLIPYVLVMPDQVGDEFYPSTRSMAIRREVGLFDESLTHNEDYAFAHTLKKNGMSFAFAPQAIVTWLPRKNIKEAAWMFMRFAIGDIQAGIIRPKVKFLAIRYYLFFFLFFINPWFGLLVVPYLVWSIFKNFKYVKRVEALIWLPTLQLTADIMVLFGSLVGLLSRIK